MQCPTNLLCHVKDKVPVLNHYKFTGFRLVAFVKLLSCPEIG
jgi:hypothetical protein